MADFLSRLAERSLGAAAVIRPVPVPLFAPAPARDLLPDTEERSSRLAPADRADSFLSATVFSHPAAMRADQLSSDARQFVRSPVNAQSDPTIVEALDTSHNEEAAAVHVLTDRDVPLIARPRPPADASLPWRSREALTRSRTATDEESTLPLPSLVIRTSQLPAPQSSAETARRGSSVVARNLVLPHERGRLGQPEQRQEKQNFPQQTTSAPPVIRVTIGRVDVRAIVPPSPAVSRAPSAPSAPRLSLQEYLGQRERRKR